MCGDNRSETTWFEHTPSASEEVAKIRLELRNLSLEKLEREGLVEWDKDQNVVKGGPNLDSWDKDNRL